MKYRDYYEILGVPRNATQDEIQRSYRKLARKYHPDINKEPGAEEKFKEINEAYEALKDPEKRKKYDQLGADWKDGQEFRPPPGWDIHFDFGQGPGTRQRTYYWSSGVGGFSDFFEALFGGGPFGEGFRSARGREPFVRFQQGEDQEAVLRISLEEAYRGGTKAITLQSQRLGPDGRITTEQKRYEVKIPPGVIRGQKIRLAGQGGEGIGGGPRGDLYLKVEIDAHPRFRLEDRDLYMDLPVTPWEAALGAKVRVKTLGEEVTITIPPGTQSGQKLRLKGKGMPNPRGANGDLYTVVQIKVPKRISQREKEMFQELARISSFNPRGGS
ncbi:MAG: J domain-containing protein [Deltaproteobacteria bacterium]|nr:J domain-containing protein [Deltaproteobacteria bacterium]